ncbi:MAG: hypothetical protein HQK53_19365 [Oligoflexia bacterium]|nr:hypothetical protein [Oligoflexia bacterium]
MYLSNLHTNIHRLRFYVAMLVFFAVGVGYSSFYIPCVAIYLLIVLSGSLSSRLSRNILFLPSTLQIIQMFIPLSLALGYFVSLFLIGHERMTLASPFKIMILISCLLILVTFIVSIEQNASKENKFNLLTLLLSMGLGFFTKSSLVFFYSMFIDSKKYGYGCLLHPISKQEVNSPEFSNLLIIPTILFLYNLISVKTNNANGNKMTYLLPYSILIVLAIAEATILQGRIFFLLVGITFLLFMLKYYLRSSFSLILGVCGTAILFATPFALEHLPSSLRPSILTYKRIATGIHSSRFSLWSDGLQKLWAYPQGGFSVDQSIEPLSWFHNLWLDSARVAGFLPLFPLLLLNGFFIWRAIKKARTSSQENAFILFWLQLITLALMFQDVIVEGNFPMFVCYFLIGIL